MIWPGKEVLGRKSVDIDVESRPPYNAERSTETKEHAWQIYHDLGFFMKTLLPIHMRFALSSLASSLSILLSPT